MVSDAGWSHNFTVADDADDVKKTVCAVAGTRHRGFKESRAKTTVPMSRCERL